MFDRRYNEAESLISLHINTGILLFLNIIPYLANYKRKKQDTKSKNEQVGWYVPLQIIAIYPW
jgi:hypothetical protein